MAEKFAKKMMHHRYGNNIRIESKDPVTCIHFYSYIIFDQMV